jgi:hypothetical protein
LAGFTLGLAGPLVHGRAALDWRFGLAPPALLAIAYTLIDARRQAALAAGGDAAAVRRRFLAPTIAAFVCAPLLGVAVYAAPAFLAPPPVAAAPAPVESKSNFLPDAPADVPETGLVR